MRAPRKSRGSCMSSERTRQLLDLVAGALDVAENERASWLAKACEDDPSLYAEAADLIGLEAEANAFLPVQQRMDVTPANSGPSKL